MIVRILLWRLDEATASLDDLRDGLDELEPLTAPSTVLVNEAAERIGALVFTEDDEGLPAQVEELRALVGRDPDVYEEFDTL
jgi:hypothetical protein